MKKIITRIFCSVLIVSLLTSCAPGFAHSNNAGEISEVIIVLDKNADPDKSKAYIKSLVPEAEFGYDYTNVVFGFSARFPLSELELLQNLDCVEMIFNDTKYSPLSLEESEEIVIYAPALEPVHYPDRGAHSVVAILDDGFFLKHNIFTLADNSDVKITKRKYKGETYGH